MKTSHPMIQITRSAGALLLAALLASCASGEAEEAPSIQSVTAERGDLRVTAEATGTVEPVRRVEVKSKASGEILRLHADVGDVVEPGALLVEVDPRDVRNRYDQTVADLEVAEARLEIARAQLGRSEELFEAGAITQQELEQARLEDSNAQANSVKARTDHSLARLQLGDATVRAPMAGTILQKDVEEGQVIQSASQNVSGGTTLFVMASLGEMQVRTLVDETDMGQIREGMTARVEVEAYPDRTFAGEVRKIEPQAMVEQNVTMFPVIVQLDNRDGYLRPGMNAEVEILVDQALGVLLVPNNAVVMPRDAGPAAMALGLDPLEMDLSAVGGGGFGPEARGGEGRERREDGAAGGRDGAERGPPAADGRRPGGDGPDEAADGPRDAGDEPIDGARRIRPAVVFVLDEEGRPEPREVRIGLNDWDRTEVVSGLEEGDRVASIGAAQLQAQQQEFLDRVRSRRSGPFGG